MARVMDDAFEGIELELIQGALATLSEVGYFERRARQEMENLIVRFDSLSSEQQLEQASRISAQRLILLTLAAEAKAAVQATDSAKETDNVEESVL